MQDHVGVGRGRDRVREGERAADDDQRVPAAASRRALVGERRDARQVEAVDQARQLQLVGERERDDGEVTDRPRRLVGAQRLARRARLRASSGRNARSALTSGSAFSSR